MNKININQRYQLWHEITMMLYYDCLAGYPLSRFAGYIMMGYTPIMALLTTLYTDFTYLKIAKLIIELSYLK
jgi:hypothetical protein